MGEEGGEEAQILLDVSNRLAQYEDSGLSPDEVQQLAKTKEECALGKTVFLTREEAEKALRK